MNNVGPGTLNAVEAADLLVCLGSLVRDTDTSGSLTVSTPTAPGTMDPATGIYSATEAVDSVTGWTAPLTMREVSQSAGRFQAGDRRFIVMAADVSAVPTTSPPTRVRFDSINYSAISVERDPLGHTHHIIARRIQ